MIDEGLRRDGLGGHCGRSQLLGGLQLQQWDTRGAQLVLTDGASATIEGTPSRTMTSPAPPMKHGAVFSVLMEEPYSAAKLMRGRRAPEVEEPGASYSAALAVGAHAVASAPLAPYCQAPSHIYEQSERGSPRRDRALGLHFGGYGDPPATVASDPAAIEGARGLFGGVERVAVEKATSTHAAERLHPGVASRLISKSAERATKRAVSWSLSGWASRWESFASACGCRRNLEGPSV